MVDQPAIRPLRRTEDFARVMRTGKRARGRLIHLVAAPQEDGSPGVETARPLGSRFGLAVGKRVGNAVVRNRVKRRLRMIMRSVPVRAGRDLVIVAQPPSAEAHYQDLERAVHQAIERLGLTERHQEARPNGTRQDLPQAGVPPSSAPRAGARQDGGPQDG